MSADKRARMVEGQLLRRGIYDERVLAAMGRVPRELFVPPDLRSSAYADAALPIGAEQTISQPAMVALICEQLALQGSERVLDVGTGSGYQAAVLAELAGEVHTIERIPELADLGGRHHAGGGSHGSLVAGDSIVPLLTIGVDAEPARITEIAPAVLAHFGVTPPESMETFAGVR